MEKTTKKRGHRKENTEVNEATIALWICGTSQWGISRLLHKDRWNIQKVQKKYYDKYAPIIMEKICKFIINQGTSKKPTKTGGK
tara:strand:- start:1796 stop:2047 length:252 start_codon:yes stop_codon:yes gene_type:complete